MKTIIRVWLFLHYPIWLPTWQVKIVLVKTLETLVKGFTRNRFLGYFAESAERIELAKIKEKLCSTHLETFFKTRNLGFGFPIRHHRNAVSQNFFSSE